MLEYAKMAIPITSTAYDALISNLIQAAYLDLGIAGVSTIEETDPLIITAVCTYVKLHMPHATTDDGWSRLKAAYDEQKAQLGMATGYTDWGGQNG